MWVGSEFQASGPATANEPAAKCVLVRRTVKSPRTDDRRRLSLHRLHKSAKYPGAVPWNTSNIRTHSLYFMRLEIVSQCRRCSSGAAWLWAGSEQTRQAALSWIRCIFLRTATLQFAKSPLHLSKRAVVNEWTSSRNAESSMKQLYLSDAAKVIKNMHSNRRGPGHRTSGAYQ